MKEPEVPACEPIIEIQTQYVSIPSEHLQLNDNPAIPDTGDNAALLGWAMACAANHRLYEKQIRAIRDLND